MRVRGLIDNRAFLVSWIENLFRFCCGERKRKKEKRASCSDNEKNEEDDISARKERRSNFSKERKEERKKGNLRQFEKRDRRFVDDRSTVSKA